MPARAFASPRSGWSAFDDLELVAPGRLTFLDARGAAAEALVRDLTGAVVVRAAPAPARLARLRELARERGVAVVVAAPSADPGSEDERVVLEGSRDAVLVRAPRRGVVARAVRPASLPFGPVAALAAA